MTDLEIISQVSNAIDGKDGVAQMQALVDVVRGIAETAVKEACTGIVVERNAYRKSYLKTQAELQRVRLDTLLMSMATGV